MATVDEERAEFRAKSALRLGSPVALLSRAQSDIEFLLGVGGSRIERSTFGAMLEQAELYAFDDAGRPLPKRNAECMVIKHQKGEPGYDLDFAVLAKLGRANRYLDAVGREKRVLREVLEAYHGDRGERWGRPYKQDNSGGVGDRFVALYPITVMGKKWLGALRSKFPISGELRADEVLANEYAAQRSTPSDDMRRHRLFACAEQSRLLLAAAHAALQVAAVSADTTAREIRRTSLRMEQLTRVPWQERLIRSAGGDEEASKSLRSGLERVFVEPDGVFVNPDGWDMDDDKEPQR